MVQEFIPVKKHGEKRIVILNGEFLAAYEKRARGREFRANLGLGATFHNTRLSIQEKKLLAVLRPFLIKRGLYFAGVDVLEGKLIEINVTSPAGVTETKFLNPKSRPVEAWADFLEELVLQRHRF
jgi:glutathione synthase